MNVPVMLAAKLIGTSADSLRWALQKERVDIGWAIKKSQRWMYKISPKKLADYTGEPLEKINQLVADYRKGARA